MFTIPVRRAGSSLRARSSSDASVNDSFGSSPKRPVALSLRCQGTSGVAAQVGQVLRRGLVEVGADPRDRPSGISAFCSHCVEWCGRGCFEVDHLGVAHDAVHADLRDTVFQMRPHCRAGVGLASAKALRRVRKPVEARSGSLRAFERRRPRASALSASCRRSASGTKRSLSLSGKALKRRGGTRRDSRHGEVARASTVSLGCRTRWTRSTRRLPRSR